MREITTGKLLQSTREAQSLSTAKLVEGICSRRTLQRLENGQTECDMLMFSVLLQRLGKSPDKLEYIFSWQEYRKECIRDWFVECVFKKKKKWAERAIELYWKKTEGIGTVHRMYLCRGRAMVAYWIDGDAGEAEKWLEKALDATFPRWRCAVLKKCRVSATELENLLALVRVRREQGKDVQELLQSCGRYIDEFVTDGEEHAKIFCKYAWLEAGQKLEQGCPGDALWLCLSALEELRQYGIEYFMSPLFDMAIQCYVQMKREDDILLISRDEKSGWALEDSRGSNEDRKDRGDEVPLISEERCRLYVQILGHLREQFGETWYPNDSILYNCSQKSYHLDYEILCTENSACGQRSAGKTRTRSQGAMAGGMQLKSMREACRRTGKMRPECVPDSRHFVRAMERIGLERERRSSFVITDSFETLELRREIQKYVSRKQYDKVKDALGQLEQRLDMRIFENQRVVQLLRNMVDMNNGTRSYEEMLTEDWQLLSRTYCFVPAEYQEDESTALRKADGTDENESRQQQIKEQIFSRAPMKNETDAVNQIAILLERLGRGEEALRLYEWAIHAFRRSRVRERHRFFSYGLLLGNMAAKKGSATESSGALRYSLHCGKLGFLGKDYLTLACALEDEPSNRELCRRMIQEAYYLFELSYSSQNQSITRRYYADHYGGDVEGF